MTKAHIVSTIVFLGFQAGGLFALARFGGPAFAFMGMAGCILSAIVFNRLAPPDDKRRDLEDRVRNPP